MFLAPLDILIRRDPLRTRQPDLMFISNARRYIIGRQVIEGGPDLVIEILSPPILAANSRRSFKTISQLACVKPGLFPLKGGRSKCCSSPRKHERLGLYGLGDTIVSQVLPDLRLTVAEIFPEF